MNRTLLLVSSGLLLLILLSFIFFRITTSASKPVEAPMVTAAATLADDSSYYQLRLNSQGFELKAGSDTQKGSYNDLLAALANIEPALKDKELLVRVREGTSFEQVSKTIDHMIALGLPRYRLVNDK